MSFTGVFGVVLLGIVGIALLGPSKLPMGVEQLWLMITNFRRSQSELPPINIEQARRMWEASESPLYDLVQILYGSVEHLVELRRRIFIVLGTLIGAALVGLFFANKMLQWLALPAHGAPLIVLRPTDMVLAYIEVVLSFAAIITMPVMLFQVLMFIRPALETEQEISTFKMVAIVGMPLVLIFFLIGASFSYFIMLPFALQYLMSFGNDVAKASWNVREYYSFVFAVIMWIGASFETPLVMALLSRLGLVSPHQMARQWRYAIVGCALVAAAITPTVDPFNMALVMLPLLCLYFGGVLLARLAYRPRHSSLAEAVQ
jgi:sec-independent protein translocase protein TatC